MSDPNSSSEAVFTDTNCTAEWVGPVCIDVGLPHNYKKNAACLPFWKLSGSQWRHDRGDIVSFRILEL